MFIKLTLLTCKLAFWHKQLIICEDYGAPSCPYFVLQAWLPNSPSAILEQELHLLKKQKRAQSRLHRRAVSGTKSPAVQNDLSAEERELLNARDCSEKSVFRVQVHYGYKDASLKSSRNSSRK